jgi:hypothetical protein
MVVGKVTLEYPNLLGKKGYVVVVVVRGVLTPYQ